MQIVSNGDKFASSDKSCFLGKNKKKKNEYVVFWKFYPEC